MQASRRAFLAAATALPFAPSLALADEPATAPARATLPDVAEFSTGGLVYLDSGSQHPLGRGARSAVGRYLAKRALEPDALSYQLPDDGVREKFAKLVNAYPDEIAYVQSTTAAEQMFVRGLGLPAAGAHVVTDTLHFFGSLPLYAELGRQGCAVSWVRDRDGRIPIEDVRAALRPDTRLVSLSLVSTINGFEHDLKAVCDAAHAHGALVYADIIHGAGAIPVDLHASGVDFAACATYKWLMGDFGLGFAYVARDARSRLKRTEYGYYGMDEFKPHVYPFDPLSTQIVDYTFAASAEGILAHGTHAHAVIAQLDHSLEYLLGLGVDKIQQHAKSLTDHLKEGLQKLGYTLMTPRESRAPIVACAYLGARTKLAERLKTAGVRITISENRFRATPSVFNTHADIERLLAALGHA